ncbi:MAG TPA: tetratricopeptide repeat protein, partial [Candidatus Acidoferrum sp.]|nr:tetratricopeptide repeat protein [Candidatus Acidoferrum sp.]
NYDEAQKNLSEAMGLARDLQNKTLIAQILNFQGDAFFYRGDLRQASDLFAQAVKASSSPDVEKGVALLSQYNLAKCAVEEKRSPPLPQLKALVRSADAAGLKNVSTAATLTLAEALINARQYPAAKSELQAALASSDKLGLQVQQARAQYLLGRALEAAGDGSEAASHYAAAKRALQSIRQESGSDTLLKRQDLSAIAAR